MNLGDIILANIEGKWVKATIENIYIDYKSNLYEVKTEDGEEYTLEGEKLKEQSNGEN